VAAAGVVMVACSPKIGRRSRTFFSGPLTMASLWPLQQPRASEFPQAARPPEG
jgi:hypothetical protein